MSFWNVYNVFCVFFVFVQYLGIDVFLYFPFGLFVFMYLCIIFEHQLTPQVGSPTTWRAETGRLSSENRFGTVKGRCQHASNGCNRRSIILSADLTRSLCHMSDQFISGLVSWVPKCLRKFTLLSKPFFFLAPLCQECNLIYLK